MQKIDDCKEIRLALTRAGIATCPEKCLQTFRLVVTAQYIYHTNLAKTGLPINGWSISSWTMICRTPRMHRGPDGVVKVIADMGISVALHLCLSLLPLIAMFSMMGSGNTSTLRGNPRFLSSSTALRGISE
jgi:hypothetical protein